MKPIKVHLFIIYPISNSLHNKNVFDYIFVVYVSTRVATNIRIIRIIRMGIRIRFGPFSKSE